MALSVVVLAAGKGTRMKSGRPKVLQPLCGRPILAHVLDTCLQLKAERTVVVYGHGGDKVQTEIPGDAVIWVEQAQQLGTAHAVSAAMTKIPANDTVLVLYGDVPLLRLATLRNLVDTASDGLAILTAHYENPRGYGRIVRDDDGSVKGIVEEADASVSERSIQEINTGVMVAPAWRLKHWLPQVGNSNHQREYYLTDLVPIALKDGASVSAVVVDDVSETLGINDRLQLAAAEDVIRARIARQLLRSGVALADPSRIDVRGEVECGQDVYIDANCVLSGKVWIGDGASIGPGVVLSNARIGACARVRAYCVIEDAVVDNDAVVGPFAHVRPGSRIGSGAHVGNFVELKNTTLGKGSKANHLSYLGDARIGTDVNIGAGVITCNYDGAAKHSTEIGDGAFIGSDCPLVAPVRIGEQATVGAGSTITEDVPPGKLVVARARQVTVDGWKRPEKKPRGDR